MKTKRFLALISVLAATTLVGANEQAKPPCCAVEKPAAEKPVKSRPRRSPRV
jgi:hypothetical protein